MAWNLLKNLMKTAKSDTDAQKQLHVVISYILSYWSQGYSDVSARNTTRALSNIQKLLIEKLKSLGKEKYFQLAFENVN